MTVILTCEQYSELLEQTISTIYSSDSNIHIIVIDVNNTVYNDQLLEFYHCEHVKNEHHISVDKLIDQTMKNVKTKYYFILNGYTFIYTRNWKLEFMNVLDKNDHTIVIPKEHTVHINHLNMMLKNPNINVSTNDFGGLVKTYSEDCVYKQINMHTGKIEKHNR